MMKRLTIVLGHLVDRFPAIAYGAIGLAALLLFFWIQSSGHIPDPDSFYHARMAALIAERGPVMSFPWLNATTLVDSYVDHHFLYHVLLIPFVKIWGLAAGIRISSIFFAVLATLGSARLLRTLGVGRIAFFAPLLLLLSNPLVFRLNLAKAPAVALIFLGLGFWAAARRRPLLLGFVAFFYVWLYNGWVLLPVVVALFIITDAFLPERPGQPTEEAGWHWRDRLFGRRSRALAGATTLGLLLGHVINPYFPENFSFEWLHIGRIGLVGLRAGIGVGAEWYPYALGEFLAATTITFLALLLGAVVFFAAQMQARDSGVEIPRDRLRETTVLFLFTLLAWAFTLRSKRNIEYFVPAAVLFAVSAGDLWLRRVESVGTARRRVTRTFYRRRSAVGAAALGVLLASAFVYLATRDLAGVKKDFDNGTAPQVYVGLANWLDKNTPAGTLVWHNDWDDFPFFFFHSAHNRWLVGLDPRFMYLKNPALFREWVEITQGRQTDRLAERIRGDFGADYAFVDRSHVALRAAVEANREFHEVYSDREGTIYRLASSTPSGAPAAHESN